MAIHECEELKKRGTGLTEWLFTTPKNEDSIDWSLRITLFTIAADAWDVHVILIRTLRDQRTIRR